MGSFGRSHLLLPLILSYILFNTLEFCVADSAFPCSSLINIHHAESQYATHTIVPNVTFLVGESTTQTFQTTIPSLHKRRVPARPSGSKFFSAPPVETTTIYLFKWKFTFVDEDLLNRLFKLYYDLTALALVGIDIEQHALALHIGNLDLNLYAVGEALTQQTVLAVVKRLVQVMKVRSGFLLGEGVAFVGAGVRVLFAVGVRLRGAEDIYWEVVRPVRQWIG